VKNKITGQIHLDYLLIQTYSTRIFHDEVLSLNNE
jgi:hypothetical protein